MNHVCTACLAVIGYILANKVVAALIVTSAIKVAPMSRAQWNTYDFFYDWTHQFFNITNNRLLTTTPPSPPESNKEAPK